MVPAQDADPVPSALHPSEAVAGAALPVSDPVHLEGGVAFLAEVPAVLEPVPLEEAEPGETPEVSDGPPSGDRPAECREEAL